MKREEGFFEVMPKLTRVAFGLFLLAKLLGFSSMAMMWVARIPAGILLAAAFVALTASVTCAIMQMNETDSKKEYLAVQKRYEELSKLYGEAQ